MTYGQGHQAMNCAISHVQYL